MERAKNSHGVGVVFGGGVRSVPGVCPAERMLRRFAFAVANGKAPGTTEKRRRAVAEYVVDWLGSAEIVDEWEDAETRWLVVQMAAPIAEPTAERFAKACPYYVPRTFSRDRDP